MFGYNSVVASLLVDSERKAVASLLASLGLSFDEGADYTVLIEDENGGLAATASLFGNVIRMVAVDPAHQEAGLSAVAISNLMETARSKGIFHLFIYTKPDMAHNFKALGFRAIAETDSVALLETGEPGIEDYRRYLLQSKFDSSIGKIGSVVVNCNPFTLGHRYLIETASSACDFLYVIVVETDLSVFPFADRLAMVNLGTSDFENVKVLKSGEYAVSAATFPTYFLKDKGLTAVAGEQARLDVDLFSRLFVKELNISVRFIGTERNCAVTALYNRAMIELLPKQGVQVCEIERAVTESGAVVSASAVRQKMKSGDLGDMALYLPLSTVNYLRENKYKI